MEQKFRHFTFRDVVVVADLFDTGASGLPPHERHDLEMTDNDTLHALCRAVAQLGLKVHHYSGPDELARHADLHREDIVLSIYGGQRSRNRMALVPAVCEAFGLRFIGPDVYGRVIAQDKEVSKRLAKDCGLRTPAWRVVRSETQLASALGIRLPVVVKPLLEGSSIGISQGNLAFHYHDVVSVGRKLLRQFEQPIIIEEFVPGREVSFSKIHSTTDDVWSFSEIVVANDPKYFNLRLFDAQEKLVRTSGRSVKNIDGEMSEDDRKRLEKLLSYFGPYGYCRVDGRLSDGTFVFLELTPDAWIGRYGQFAMGFTLKGWDYTEVIAAVLTSTD